MARFIALPILPVACLLWCIGQALGLPAPRPERLTIHLQGVDLLAAIGTSVTVYFNPKEMTIDKAVPWQSKKKSQEGDRPPLEFSAGQARSMSFELMMDLYEDSPSSEEIIASLQRQVGKPIPMTWTKGVWMGTLQSVNPAPAQGDQRGKPTRLTLDSLWSDFTPVEPSDSYRFTVDIPGAPEAAARIREVSVDPVALPPDPQADSLPRARLTIASPRGLNPDLLKWQEAWDLGDQARRLITFSIFDERLSILRSYSLDAGGPVRYAILDPNQIGDPNIVPQAMLEVTVAGVRLDGRTSDNLPPEPPSLVGVNPRPDPLPFFGYSVKITGPLGEATAFFKSVTGLKSETEITDYQEGGITGFTRKVVGVTKWPHLTLVGIPKDPKPLFIQWVSDAAGGKPWPATIEIAPLYLLDGKPHRARALVLQEVVPDRTVLPELSGLWSDGDVTEKISLPPALGVVK